MDRWLHLYEGLYQRGAKDSAMIYIGYLAVALRERGMRTDREESAPAGGSTSCRRQEVEIPAGPRGSCVVGKTEEREGPEHSLPGFEPTVRGCPSCCSGHTNALAAG